MACAPTSSGPFLQRHGANISSWFVLLREDIKTQKLIRWTDVNGPRHAHRSNCSPYLFSECVSADASQARRVSPHFRSVATYVHPLRLLSLVFYDMDDALRLAISATTGVRARAQAPCHAVADFTTLSPPCANSFYTGPTCSVTMGLVGHI
jgi:hypothetical protein